MRYPFATVRHLTVVGSFNMDLVVHGARLPRPGETVVGGTFRASPGGKGANQAAAAAALGAPVRFVGCVGDDEYGRLARAVLAERGVDVSALATTASPTGVALIVVDEEGQNQICVAPGANALVRPSGEHDLVLMQLETPYERPRARTLVLNPAPARPVDLAGVDFVIPNELEARALTGERDPARQKAALEERGAACAIITLGARGVFDGRRRPAFAVPVVDTVGAGDTFVGAFAAGLAEGHPDPVRLGQAAAALQVGRRGAMTAPTREEVEAFLARAPLELHPETP